MAYIFIYIILSSLTALLVGDKKFGYVLGFVLCLIFTPIIGSIITITYKKFKHTE